ncbi:MAG: hypothetical protein JXA25_00845 [Anaerolineales bacterium]|nr:hypothetical protein [Anaerolineales bacterium]
MPPYNSIVIIPESIFQQLTKARIAADARLTTTNYADDQIWELNLTGGEPDALSVSTSYGLRTREVRLFPAFSLNGTLRTSPEEFAQPPAINAYYPNYVRASFYPYNALETQAEYWTPESNTLAGRFCLANHGEEPLNIQLILFVVHQAGAGGRAFINHSMEGVNVLSGSAGNLQPVVFLSGGAVPAQAVFPGLSVSTILQPGDQKTWTWVHAGYTRKKESFSACRKLMKENWDARVAYLEMVNAGMLQIETGDPAWDQAFYLSQKTALGSLMSSTFSLPHDSYVNGRLPDRGYSMEGRGRDYDSYWGGQTVQEAWYLIPQLIYTAPDMAKGIILNFLHRQRLDGFTASKPGLAGQRDGNRCPPLLATLVWKLYQHTRDRSLLFATRDGLVALFKSWFSEEQDLDGDGFPEWNNVFHAEFEHWKPFVRWYSWGQGMELTKAETIDLLSFLLREVNVLQFILKETGDLEGCLLLDERKASLLTLLDESWLESEQSFSHRDRDTHEMLRPERIGKGKGAFVRKPGRAFEQSVRVLARIRGDENLSRNAVLRIHGRGHRGRGRIEELGQTDFSWFREFGSVTSEKTYRYIEKIEIRGLSKSFSTELLVPGTFCLDSSVLLPLWSGSLEPEKAQLLIQQLLQPDTFWLSAGIPQCAASEAGFSGEETHGCGVVSMVRNAQIGEGLLMCGCRAEAAELVQKLMKAVTETLHRDQGFRSFYDAVNHTGSGSLDAVQGLAPIDLFLRTVGIHLISTTSFIIDGYNPYPWPVTVHWKGLSIRREQESTQIIFPDGQELVLEGEEKRHITLSRLNTE